MIYSLRRTHRWVFVILAILIATIIYVGLISRRSYPADSLEYEMSLSSEHPDGMTKGQ